MPDISRIFRLIQSAFVLPALLLALLAVSAHPAEGASRGPADSWAGGEGTIFTSPQNAQNYQQYTGTPNPLPRGGGVQQGDALGLSWGLRVLSPPPAQEGAAQPGLPPWLKESPLWLLVRVSPKLEGGYFYAPFSKDQSSRERAATAGAVLPTTLKILDENGEPVEGARFYYPSGSLKEDSFSGLRLPVYENEILIMAAIPGGLLGKKLDLGISALICTKSACTPFRRLYPLALNSADIANESLAPELLEALADYQISFADTALPVEAGAAQAAEGGAVPGLTPQDAAALAAQYPSLLDKAITDATMKGLLESYIHNVTPRYRLDFFEVGNIWRAVALGLLAGFILNFMPCVLPVISLKLGTLAGLGGWQGLARHDEAARKSRRRFRIYGLCYTLGVFAWFCVLFGVLGFAGLIWGQLFQSQGLIIGLTVLLFVMSLALFGFINIPLLNIQINSEASLPHQAFFGGLLATLLATPCSGPLLGGVLGWVVNQPLPYLAATLAAVAVGMASPFILMTIKPGLSRLLPKPGPWTVTLERIMGFVLLGTVLYLLSMLDPDKLFAVLGALLLVSFALWLWSRPLPEGETYFSFSRLVAVAALFAALYFPLTRGDVEIAWKDFSAASFQADLGRRNILLDFTADWCINCRAMEATTLAGQRRAGWARDYDLVFVKVDLTNSNPEGEALLAAMGSASIPLLAIIPADRPASPLVLRDLITTNQLDSALKSALGN